MAATLDISRPTLHVPTDAFRNEPLTDFSNSETARRMQQALVKVRAELGREYDMVIGENSSGPGEDNIHESGKAVRGHWHLSKRRQGTRGNGDCSRHHCF